MRKIIGTPYAYAETGTEGFYWSVTEDGIEEMKSPYDGLHLLEEDDHLMITNKEGQVLFEGVIKKDTETGKIPRPFNPSYLQQVAGGVWVHWIQKGFDPDIWADLFADNSG